MNKKVSVTERKASFDKGIVISICLIALLGSLVYFNSLRNEFVLDDYLLVRDNVIIKGPAAVSDAFTKNVGESLGRKFGFYRPIQVLSYIFDYRLWKLDVTGYHLTNIILHIMVALCVFWLILLIFGDKTIAFLTSAFFVVHPVHTEAVTYISGRADPLAALFILLCAVFYVKYNRIKSPYMFIEWS